jgi:hypothetical protein
MKNDKKNNVEFILYNTQNYKDNLVYDLFDILNNYLSIVFNYLKYISENKLFINKHNYKYIINKGIATISHIFKFILMYSKNIELTTYYGQKSYYFYIEFIEQISQDNNIFLKLNTNDAILFVYKKTIFEINNDYIKNNYKLTNSEIKLLNLSNLYIDTFNNIFNYHILYDNKKEFFNNNNYINNIYDKIIYILDINKYKYDEKFINYLYLLVNKLISNESNLIDFFILLETFIKYTNNHKLLNNLEYNIINCDFSQDPTMIIKKIFAPT